METIEQYIPHEVYGSIMEALIELSSRELSVLFDRENRGIHPPVTMGYRHFFHGDAALVWTYRHGRLEVVGAVAFG